MAFEFTLSTDEIREKMFGFIKPVYKNTWDFEFGCINWISGVYDSEIKFFITYVNSKNDNTKYVLITENGNIFYLTANRYRYTISEIPEELVPYENVIHNGIKLYNNESKKKRFENGFSAEQKKNLDEIIENMKDRCRPNVAINSYEDAEKLFEQDDYNYWHISHMYNKSTIENFDKYMPDSKMRSIISEKYRMLISKICAYNNTLDEENYRRISNDFHEAGSLTVQGIDDIYADITFEAVKKAYFSGVISCSYAGFIENYIKCSIRSFPERIQELRPLLDFINENMSNKYFKNLVFYRKELEKLIYKKSNGFQFVCTTDELREVMFDFLKPEYKTINDFDASHINWKTGVYDKESGIFLTQIYYLSDGISRCGVHYHSYIVITDSGSVFKVDNNDLYEKEIYDFRIPKQYEMLTDKVKEGIDFYGYNFTYRTNLSEDMKKQLKSIEEAMDDRCHRNFPINCEEDAKKLLELSDFNTYLIFSIYNKKTISDFNKFADDDKMMIWRSEKYLQMLKKAKSIIITEQERCQAFSDACNIFCKGVNETYDKQFLDTVKSMYGKRMSSENLRKMENTLRIYINTYAEEYPDKLKDIVPLIEFVKTHSKDKYLMDAVEKAVK